MIKSNLAHLEQTLNYVFTDKNLFFQALTHRSVGVCNNERLEFLGDSILNFCVSQFLFDQFPSASEGDLSRARASLVKGETLAEIATDFSLGDFLNLGEGEMKSGGFRRPSILADAVEAIIGAIYLDAGMDTITVLLKRWFTERLNAIEINKDSQKDTKTRLQEWLQARKFALPIYELKQTSGKSHEQLFDVECQVKAVKRLKTTASATNRRLAEKQAAAKMLELLLVEQLKSR